MRGTIRTILCTITIGLLLALFLCKQGGLGHFSPHTLEYVTQWGITIFEVPAFRSPPRTSKNELITFLVEEGYVAPVEPEQQRWEPVFHWGPGWRDGHSTLRYMLGPNRTRTIEWCKANPRLARLYCSEGFRLSRPPRRADRSAGAYILAHGWHYETADELRNFMAAKAEVGAA